MAYCVQADVETAAGGLKTLVELCDLDKKKDGSVNTTVLAKAIADADALIDSYVAKQRSVPLSPVPATIARISAEIAVYYLRVNRRMVDDDERMRHEVNTRWLEGVARGAITLGVDPQPAKSALVSPAVVLVEEGDREITAESLEGFW